MPNLLSSATPELTYRPVGELLEKYSKESPSKVALVDIDRCKAITFGELAVAVEGIAVQLARLGVRKGSRVVLLADNSLEKILLWLGIWRAAAVVCPIDLTFIASAAPSTLKAIVPDLVISDGRETAPEVFSEIAVPVVHFALWPSSIADGCAGDAELSFAHLIDAEDRLRLPSASIDDLASMTCTSGTTGLPKIVVYDHLSYWENGQATIDFLGLTERDRILEYRSFGWYSPQILSLMPFLQTGLTMHVAQRFSYSRLPDWIEQYRVTVCAGVPTVINILLHRPVASAADRFSSLRAITCSSAPLSTAHWARFEEEYGVPLLQLYGTSEAGWICANRHDMRKIGTVGWPVKHVQFQIVDDLGELCPQGVEGQVVVNAKKLAVGYLREDGSIDAIRGKPLRVRDRAIRDREGYVQITGRTDDLIIRGGIKISPFEIDEVLLAHPEVLEAVAIGIPDPIYGQQPVCFVVPKPATELDETAILTYCAKHLAREKMPKQVFIVESLPRSAIGKILRNKLRLDYFGVHIPARTK